MSNDFHGLPTRSLANDHLTLDYLAEAGPRIVRLFLAGSHTNLLAESPDMSWDTPPAPIGFTAAIACGTRLKPFPEPICLTTAVSKSTCSTTASGCANLSRSLRACKRSWNCVCTRTSPR